MNVASPIVSTGDLRSRKSRTTVGKRPRKKSSEPVGLTSGKKRSSTDLSLTEFPKTSTLEVRVIRSESVQPDQSNHMGSGHDIRIPTLEPGLAERQKHSSLRMASDGLSGTHQFVDKLKTKHGVLKNTFLGTLKNNNYLKTAQLTGASKGLPKQHMNLRPKLTEHVTRSINLIDINNKDLELLMEKRNILPARLNNGSEIESLGNQSGSGAQTPNRQNKSTFGDPSAHQSPGKIRKSIFSGEMDAKSYVNFDTAQSPSNVSRISVSNVSLSQNPEKPGRLGTQGTGPGIGKLLISEIVQNSNDFDNFRRKAKSFKQNETVEYKPFVIVDSGNSRKHQLSSIENHWKNLKIKRQDFFNKQGQLASLMNTMFLREDDNWNFDVGPRKSSKSDQDLISREGRRTKPSRQKSVVFGNSTSKRSIIQNKMTMLAPNKEIIK